MSARVLVVDDDSITGELLTALLAHHGYEVQHAHSGAEALAMLAECGGALDVVLCDLQMPGMRGGELGRALQSARRDGPLRETAVLVGMSGSRPRADEASAFDAFVQKPFTTEELESAIAEARSRHAGSAAASNADMISSVIPDAIADAVPAGLVDECLNERTFEQLRSKLGAESARQLYAMTLDDVRARLAEMEASARARDPQEVRRQAHTIKGSCGMVGALELQAMAAATEGGSALDTSALADFNAACQRLERMLSERF
jgi:CheY-like chemotaxis protein/HPt (histidine-containing phosphotransfer) domain-containing protein